MQLAVFPYAWQLLELTGVVAFLEGMKTTLLLAGIFTPQAEITNARAAMLGFAILLLLESKSGVPFF